MSTATITSAPSATGTAPWRDLLRRLVWKEYRTLRPLWVAVFLLAIIFQGISALVAPPTIDLPAWLFGSALVATVLYAIGASSILYSAEHEDETYAFLVGLPSRWPPVFAAKALMATVSSLALAGALTLFGAAFTGWFSVLPWWPSADETQQLLGVFGVAIFEAVAWGTLFSLLVKRPLVAAVLTIVVGATVVHLAVSLSSSSSVASSDAQAYVLAIPLRMAIIGTVFLAALAAARTWLTPSLSRTLESTELSGDATPPEFASPVARAFASLRQTADRFWTTDTHAGPYSPPRMLARLLWQSWRESWKMLFVPVFIATFLLVGIGAAIGFLFGADESIIFGAATLFFAPALYGALAFHADQRRNHYRFLAEHGARPRYVWLSRHIVWLGGLVLLLTLIMLAVVSTTLLGIRYEAEHFLQHPRMYRPTLTMTELWTFATQFLAGSALAWLGALGAYGVGQFFSMLFRSEILAAFIALVLSTLLIAWASVLFAWELSPWWFLLPIALGFLGATWLRAPGWIADRQSILAWIGPAMAIVIPLALAVTALPTARLAQVPAIDSNEFSTLVAINGIVPSGPTPEATKTAELYAEAVAELDSWTESDLFERWEKPEYMESIGAYGMGAGGISSPDGKVATTTDDTDPTISTFGIDPAKIPSDEREEFFQAVRQLETLKKETRKLAIALVVKASQRPTCFFDINWSAVEFPTSGNSSRVRWLDLFSLGVDTIFGQVVALVPIIADSGDTPQARIENQIAALRMCNHLRAGQPTAVATKIYDLERDILDRIADWAAGDVPQDARRKLLDELEATFEERPDPAAAFLADRALLREVITGKAPALILDKDASTAVYLAYLANELPWERERGLRAIDVITISHLEKASDLFRYLADQSMLPAREPLLFEYISSGYLSGQMETWRLKDPAIATSYFAVMEYNSRVRAPQFYHALVDAETVRRATLLRIALAMYRKDHGKYPTTLSDLAPDYLSEVPRDPYSNQPFQYSPAGLDLPLRMSHHSADGLVPARTPFIWSVGLDNVRPVRQINVPDASGDRYNAAEVETFYILMNTDRLWNSPGASFLVFPLPK